jgi:hypothetical protein
MLHVGLWVLFHCSPLRRVEGEEHGGLLKKGLDFKGMHPDTPSLLVLSGFSSPCWCFVPSAIREA